MPLLPHSNQITSLSCRILIKGSVRDLGSIFHKAGEFYGRCGFAPLRLDAPADLVSWPVPPLKAKYTEAALVVQ